MRNNGTAVVATDPTESVTVTVMLYQPQQTTRQYVRLELFGVQNRLEVFDEEHPGGRPE